MKYLSCALLLAFLGTNSNDAVILSDSLEKNVENPRRNFSETVVQNGRRLITLSCGNETERLNSESVPNDKLYGEPVNISFPLGGGITFIIPGRDYKVTMSASSTNGSLVWYRLEASIAEEYNAKSSWEQTDKQEQLLISSCPDMILPISFLYRVSKPIESCVMFRVQYRIQGQDGILESSKKVCNPQGCRRYLEVNTITTLVSPNFPGNYPDDVNCTYVLYTPTGSTLRLQNFTLEGSYESECYDYVTIATNDTETSKLCGYKDSNDIDLMNFDSKTGVIVVKFVTDSKIVHSGFKALAYTLNEKICNYTIRELEGIITSPYYPSQYPPSVRCNILISLPEIYILNIEIEHMDMEADDTSCRRDNLTMKSVLADNSSVSHGTFCSHTKNNTVIQTSSSEVLLQFSSDSQTQGKGFKLSYRGIKSCENFTDDNSSGSFWSINYPMNYLNSQECYYVLGEVNPDYVIELEFDKFHVESEADDTFARGSSCNHDYVDIFTTNGEERICGEWRGKFTKLSFYSNTGVMKIYFSTNTLVTKPGFFARWRVISREQYDLICPSFVVDMGEYSLEYVYTARSWDESKTDCMSRGGNLVIVQNSTEQETIEQQIRSRGNCTTAQNAYWIGANDQHYEADFQWMDGSKVQYSNWFPGWSEFGFRNRQPSDDGFSGENCVELRNNFKLPLKGVKRTYRYYWNDRNCDATNPYICQYFKKEKPGRKKMSRDCNFVRHLNQSVPFTIEQSPNFPENYTEFENCSLIIIAPAYFAITFRFLAFDVEFEKRCGYDNLTLSSVPHGPPDKVLCGNWTSRTKLLQWTSRGTFAVLRFLADNSVTSKGWHVNISISEENKQCIALEGTKNSTCLTIFHNEATDAQRAQTKCTLLGRELTSLQTEWETFNFLTVMNGSSESSKFQIWGNMPNEFNETGTCLSRVITKTGNHPYVSFTTEANTVSCETKLKFFCKSVEEESNLTVADVLPVVITRANGQLRLPEHSENHYTNNEYKILKLVAPKAYRIFLQITSLDIEYQEDCLYDNVTITGFKENRTLCGTLTPAQPLNFLSENSSALVIFRSDTSVTGTGFAFTWRFVDPTACVEEDLETFQSVNFPLPYSDSVECCKQIKPEIERRKRQDRLLIMFSHISLLSPTSCFSIHDEYELIYHTCGPNLKIVNKTFLSRGNFANVCYNVTEIKPGEGFKGSYSLVAAERPRIYQELTLDPGDSLSGHISSINYPNPAPIDHLQLIRLRTNIGYRISICFTKIHIPNIEDCNTCNVTCLEVLDESFGRATSVSKLSCASGSPIGYGPFTSDLNRLAVKFVTGTNSNNTWYLAKYTLEKDPIYLERTIKVPENSSIDECHENRTCLNQGNCSKRGLTQYKCTCPPDYTGLFCQVTWCEAYPCGSGLCNHTGSERKCICDTGLWGSSCNLTHAQCNKIYCDAHGVCLGDNRWKPRCKCNSYWSGDSCSRRTTTPSVMTSVSQKLLKEPIWVGMIVMLNLLLIFGSLYIVKKKCGKYIKCCRDTKEILRRREDGIPAHSNDPVPKSPTYSEQSCQETSSTFLTVAVVKDSAKHEDEQSESSPTSMRTPTISISNQEAAARLFASYKLEDEDRNVIQTPPSPVGGIVGGTLVLSRNSEHLDSRKNSDFKLQFPPVNIKHRRLKHNYTTSIVDLEERKPPEILIRSNTIAVTNPSDNFKEKLVTGCRLPEITVMNDGAEGNVPEIQGTTSETDFLEIPLERHGEYCRHDSLSPSHFSSLGASDRRRTFALKAKSTFSRMDYDSSGEICDEVLDDRQMFSKSLTSLMSNDIYNKDTYSSSRGHSAYDIRRGIMMKAGRSVPDFESEKSSSFSFSDDMRAHSLPTIRDRSKKNSRDRKRYHIYVTRQKEHHPFNSCRSYSVLDSESDVQKYYSETNRQNNRKLVSNRRRKSRYRTRHGKSSSDINIYSSNSDRDDMYKFPIRKSKSNDLNYRHTDRTNKDVLPKHWVDKRFRHSFHAKDSVKTNVKDPDEMLNDDQTQNYRSKNNSNDKESDFDDDNYKSIRKDESERRHNALVEHSSAQISFSDSVPSSAVFSVNETDTGFSSSSKSFISTPRRRLHSDMRESSYDTQWSRKTSVSRMRDSAYQTHQSSEDWSISVDRGERQTEKAKSDERRVYKQLQQAALKLTMYNEKTKGYDGGSKDSIIDTISEDDCLNGYKLDRSKVEGQARRTSLPSMFNKAFPLEQVSEETDNFHTPDSKRESSSIHDQHSSEINDVDISFTFDNSASVFSIPVREMLSTGEEIEMASIDV